MSAVWSWILGGIKHLVAAFKGAISGMVGKVLGTFGLSLVTFSSVLPNLKAFITSQLSGMPAEAMDFLGAIGLGQAMSMILSALTVRMAWKVFIVPKSVADSLGG